MKYVLVFATFACALSAIVVFFMIYDSDAIDIVPSTLDDEFEKAHRTASDSNEHLPAVYELSKRCNSALEVGVRSEALTWALLRGLRDNPNKQSPKLYAFVNTKPPNFEAVKRLAAASDVDFTLFAGVEPIIESVDLIVINTWHVYGQLKRDLQRFAPRATKYLVLPFSSTDAVNGESVRLGHDIASKAKETGLSASEIRRGIQPAIQDFLRTSGKWNVHYSRSNNNGLLVLARK